MDEEDTAVYRLEKPINLNSLRNANLKEFSTEFSIRTSDLDGGVEEDLRWTDVYENDEIEPHILIDDRNSGDEGNEIDDDDDDDDDVFFPGLRKKMTNVTPDGKVMKMVVRPGSGDLISEDDDSNWVWYAHYSGYTELGEQPIDCSYLRRKRPEKLRSGYLFTGFEIAIRSMRKNEKSNFLIHPDLAYGAIGARPKIPPNATLYYQIELLDLCREEETRDPRTCEEEKRDPETWQDRIAKAKKFRECGNKKQEREKSVNGAIFQYRKGIQMLGQPGLLINKEKKQDALENEKETDNTSRHYIKPTKEEEEEISDELLKLYTNLAFCHLQKKNYRRVCSTYDDASMDKCGAKLDKSAKLNYFSAKALRYLGNFSEAKKHIHKALNAAKPSNEDILKELKEIETMIKKANKEEKSYARRMMGFDTADEGKNAEDTDFNELSKTVDPEYKRTFHAIVATFLNNPSQHSMRLPNEHSLAELKYCRQKCDTANIEILAVGPVGRNRITLKKRDL